MPFGYDHLHCIWTLPPDDADYPLRWGLIKRMVSLACAPLYHRVDWMTASKTKHRESIFWQRRYWEHTITSESDYSHHMDYIAINPVKDGFVTRVRDLPKGIKAVFYFSPRCRTGHLFLGLGWIARLA